MSKYWDDFERRIKETVFAIKTSDNIPIRRVAVFITDKCNFKCHYCNVTQSPKMLSKEHFKQIVHNYGENAIIHITGGEPSMVPWLYEYIEATNGVRFHLNTNAFIAPPKNIKRLKVSLDTADEAYFNYIVSAPGSFKTVVSNIQKSCGDTVVSITYTLTKENYQRAPSFMRWCRFQFPGLYAVFFSVYKGRSRRFALTAEDATIFFNKIKPELEAEMDDESLSLFHETIDEKFRIINGVRFPENNPVEPCYISMSERIFSPDGQMFNCSHLYRDNVLHKNNLKTSQCLYGCNRRLVAFNEDVSRRLHCSLANLAAEERESEAAAPARVGMGWQMKA